MTQKSHMLYVHVVFNFILSIMRCIRPLLDNGLKGGNSESPERASICNHFGVCLSVCMYVCDQATGHSFRPSKLIF